MLSVTSTPVELIDDDTATTYYNDLDTLEGAERESRAEALRMWAEQKKSDQKREQFDTLNKIYSDFDGYVNEAGLQDFDEDSRYRTANRQFIASQFDQTPEEQKDIYSSFRDKWTESVAGKKGMSEKETFGLIKEGIDARNEVTEAANEIPGDIALSLFDSIGGGDPVDVPKLVETWKTKNAESIKKLPPGWEAPLLESAQAFHTETEGMLRDYAEPLKKVYDHFAAVTGRDTERAGETNPKNQEEMDSMVDTLASMPKPVRERAYASVVLGAKKAGQDPKTFMEQWGESWSRTLNMVRTGALTAQEMAAESDLRMLEDKASPPDYYISKSTGEKIPLANRAFHDEADLRKVTPEEIAAEADQARQKVKRFEVVRELQSVADNQFDPIEKINKGGFLGFMESMAYGSPQGLAYTATALVPVVGPYVAGAAMFSDEYNQLRQQGMSVDQAVQVGSVSAAVQAGLERTGAKAIFGKLPVFEKLMRKIGNPARVGKAGSAGVRFLAAATGEQLVEGAQDLTTPLVQDVSEALGADVPDVKWQPILEKWGGSRLDVLAASLPTILLGTGVATLADNKRFAQFEERQDIYRSMGMDDDTVKEIEDGKNLAEVQQNFQTAFGKLTPENVKAGVAYMEQKIASAQEQQQDPNTHTLTRETLADGSKKFVIRDPKGEVRYSTADEQTAQIALRELLRTQITGTTRGIFESISFFNQMNEAAGRGEDIQKFLLSDAPRTLLTDYEANPSEKNLNNLFETVRAFGQDIKEPAELANFPVLASNQGTLAEGIFKSVIQIHEGATGDKVVRDVAQDNLKRAIAENRIKMEWVRENLNQIIPQIDSKRITGYRLRTETDTDVIESFSDVALAYMVGDVREDQIPEGFRGFLRRMAIIVKDIYRRAYNLKRLVAEGKVDANFESLLADSVGLNQQARVDTARERVGGELTQGNFNYSIGSMAERIAATAVIDKDGKILSSPLKTHAQLMEETAYDLDGGEFPPTQNFGFVTTAGRFVLQKEAQQLAQQAKQVQGNQPISGEIVSGLEREGRLNPEVDPLDGSVSEINKILREVGDQMDQGLTLQNYATRDDLPEFQSSVVDDAADFADYLANDLAPQFPKEFANRIKSAAGNIQSQAVSTDTGATNYSIGNTQFKGWFGDWENDPTTASKVVDSDGKPMVVYHGTTADMSEFTKEGSGEFGRGHYFAPRADSAAFFGGRGGESGLNIMPVYLSMKRPLRVDVAKGGRDKVRAMGQKKIREQGYDGIIATGLTGEVQYVVFEPTQIKSATGNRGTFDPTSPNINYSIGKKQDADYLAAVERGDMETVQKMVDEAAKASGYSGSDHRMQHSAPDRESTALASIKTSDLLPNDYWEKPQFYQSMPEEWESFSAVKDALNRAEKYTSEGKDGGKLAKITVYRSVPKSIKEESIRNGDWVTPSKEYAALEGRSIPEGYKIISQNVSLKNLWWDGNSIAELGFDDGKDYAYKNTKNNRKLIAPVTYDENGNVIPLSQRFNPRSADINYSIGKKKSAGGIRFDEITKEDPKHDGSRVGTAWQGKVKPTTQDTNDGIATINSKELEKQMAMLTHFVDGVPLPEFITKFQNPEERMRAFIDFQKENLLALYDAFDALSHDYVIRSTHWYDGARLLAEGVRDLYGLTIEQSSAVIAVFSPMKDWFQNVAMGQRFADVMANHKNTQISKATVGNAMSEMLTAAENESDLRKAFKKIKGRSISQLLADKTEEGRKVTAVAVRLMSTHVHGLTHDVLSPEGESLGIRKNLDGTNKKLVWQSYTFIEKALSIYEDGSAKNISKVLGTEHKIRNFYNNIVAPTSPYGDATVDTHAVNAAVLFPMGNKGYLVNLNFGGAGVAGGGNSGTYWLFHEALREAAAARKVMPRQMQSITWEAIRGLFTDVKKRDKNFVANIAKIWQTSQDANSARTQIIKLGITPPEWARVGSANLGIQGGVGKNAGQNANSAGSVQSGVRQGRKGGNGSGGVNYSIASQSEIDRVNRALGGMNRGPDERLKVYQRAKQKFSKLMAWNSDELAAMADTGSDDSQIRRTQILQALGELDGILSVLPPEVRGRVGGYTKLAGIAPMDVLKDGVKVSEVSGMNGAIISAWMREGQNIGQAGKQVSLPPGYEATENLSTKRADKAIADFFRDRIKRIDTELEKVLVREYTEAITKAVKQSRPKAGDNGVRKSTLGAETQKFADMVQRATLLDDEATPKRMAEIEAALTMPDATAEDVSALSEEWSILNTFGDLDNRSSETLAQGLDWLKGELQMGREAWRIKEQARIDEQRARARQTIEWLGKGTAKKRNATKTKSELASDLANHYLLSHANFEQFVTAIFPPEIASRWAEKLRKADEASQTAEIRDRKGILDAVRAGAKAANMSTSEALLWLKADQKNAVAYLEDRMVTDERIAIELAQKIVTGEADRSKLTDADVETLRNELAALPADTQKEYVTIKRVIFRGNDVKLDMSRGKAMQYLLSWNQPDVQIKMRKEGWTDESAADLQALVNDPVSREVMAYAKELYGKGAGIVNPVYSRMFGMNMPQVKNYAPTRFLNNKDTKDIGLDGSATATGTTPGFAKSRVTHSAKIAPEDALTVMQGHIAQQAHWVHFAELAREFRAILSNPEVRESIKQTQGESVLKDAELWADQMEQRGGNKARESTWMNTILGTVLSGKAISSLGFNLKTLAMQLENTIRFGLALDMKQIVSALSNPSAIVEDIQTVWESNAIQNRLQGGATAEARFLFSRYAGKPNFAAKIAEASMTPINWLDSAGTSISSAIVYRANLNDALAAGMPENLAKQAALNAASEAIYRFAQPVSFGQKSIMENNGNVLAKTFFLFMSDPRLKTAILADAARGLATGRGNASEHIRRIVTVELMAIVSHVISSAFRDTFSDDDDEEIWNLGGFAKAILLAPLQGFFFAGTVGELAISKLTGQKFFSSTQNPLVTSMEQAIRAGTNMEDAINFDDPEAMFKEWNNIFRSMALAPWLAAPAVLLNMVKPVVGLYQNATTDE